MPHHPHRRQPAGRKFSIVGKAHAHKILSTAVKFCIEEGWFDEDIIDHVQRAIYSHRRSRDREELKDD